MKRFIIYILTATGIGLFSCQTKENRPAYPVFQKNIVVDADTADWQGIQPETINKRSHLWIGQGMVAENWLGPSDLSFRWRAAWNGNKLYFLYEVNDDRLSPFDRPNTWLNDCVELCIDPKNKGGVRKDTIDGQVLLNGYEAHFLPSQPAHAFLYDMQSVFYTANPQDSVFTSEWNGEIAVKHTETGYVIELGFSVPGVPLEKGTAIGFETGISDDDGNSRKNLLMWTGIQNDFWITMDHYGTLVIR